MGTKAVFQLSNSMDPEQKSNLEKALISQTWNKSLTRTLVAAIEKGLQKPKETKKLSALEIAVRKEKGRKFSSRPYNSEDSDE